jgi:hypothetical protein
VTNVSVADLCGAPDCGHPNPPHYRFCGRCAAPLARWRCGCGFAALKDDRFCGGCGAARLDIVEAAAGHGPAAPWQSGQEPGSARPAPFAGVDGTATAGSPGTTRASDDTRLDLARLAQGVAALATHAAVARSTGASRERLDQGEVNKLFANRRRPRG